MQPVNYGIIGLGQVSRKGHIPAIRAISDARIAAVASRRQETIEAARRLVGDAKVYRSADALIADPEVEAVLVATPNWLHQEQSIAAFEAGKHVFCEKPLGIDLEECDAILAAQRRSGKLLQVGHELRYARLTREMRAKIEAGLIGSVQLMTIQEFRFPLLPGWRQTGRTGGVMLEKNSHYFDLFNWFAGVRPRRVVGVGGNNVNKDSPLIDHCIVTVEYEGDIRATLLMCLFAEHGSQLTVDVVGDKGRLIGYLDDYRLEFHSRTSDEPEVWQFDPQAGGPWHPGFRAEHQAFIRAIREGAPILADGAAARETMRVAVAAEKAVAGAAIVEL